MMERSDRACFHCGEPVPESLTLFVLRDGQQKPVCCQGCRAVAELIFSSGLGRYYQFRQDLGRKAEEDIESDVQAWRSCDERESLWGAELAEGRRDLLLQTEGIRCAACAWLIRTHIENKPGVDSVQVDTATGYTRIIWQPGKNQLSSLAAALMEIGYKPHLPLASAEEQGRQEERRNSMKRLGVAGLGMMQVMMYAVGLYAGDAFGIAVAERSFLEWVSLMVTFPVLIYSGRIFFEGAIRSIRAGSPGMDVPVALAISLAFMASCYNFFLGAGEVWFDSVVMFIFFLSLGRHIEMMLRHRNLQAGAALARLLPEWAERMTPAGRETIPAGDLLEGDRILVRMGESFPADGEILKGTTEVDEALLTGESHPVRRHAGDTVIAGTINLSQPVELTVTASGQDTTVSALGRLLLLAQSRRPSSNAIPSWLVPMFIVAVLFIAGATWFGWQLIDPGRAFSAMLSVLVASCPCALSLALPVVYAAASRRLLDDGILLTRGEALPALAAVDTVVFDKTGTLTIGMPKISTVEMNPDRAEVSKEQALRIAYALESSSAHPIARAFEPGVQNSDESRISVENVTVHTATGVEGEINGTRWKIGKQEFALNLTPVDDDDSILLADTSSWVARFCLEDSLRQGAESTVNKLELLGVEVSVLSGDSREAVDRVADRLQISNRAARQSPEKKLARIEALRQAGRHVLMVGDGVNDAPVLAAADVSMTVKGGAELANSAADLILTSESLELIEKAMNTARSTRQLVRQNLTWAILYNASVMPLAVSGMLKPWMAALGMSLSSLLVVANASRLVRKQAGNRSQ